MVVSSLGVGTWRSESLSHVKGGVLVWCFVENLIDRLVTCKEVADNLIDQLQTLQCFTGVATIC